MYIYQLQECAVRQQNRTVGIYDSLTKAYDTMVKCVQYRVNNVLMDFLPSERFHRVYIDPENVRRWQDNWREHAHLQPWYTIFMFQLDMDYIREPGPNIMTYHPYIHLKNMIIKNDWDDIQTSMHLSNVALHFCFSSKKDIPCLYNNDIELYDVEKISKWCEKSCCNKK